MDSFHKLEEIFAKFPGIGPRQARRFVYYLISRSPVVINEFVKLVVEIKKQTKECSDCHRLFIDSNNSNRELCNICLDRNRETNTLMIIARDSDLESIERSGVYKGLYFILGGTIPIFDKEPEKRIRLESLLERISNADFEEIILSLNTTPEGENTANIIKDAISRIIKDKKVKISVLGRGLSTGSELEYVDSETIKNALKNRS